MKTLGQIIDHAKGYRYQVDFDKHFTDGNMKGITYKDKMRFASWNDADRFAQSCDGKAIVKSCCGTSNYTCENAILEAI